MPLQFQDPTNFNSPSLHEALNAACNGASTGGGAFAFATRGGIRLYFEDVSFTNFIQTGSFDLVVGIDEITNTRSLDTLSAILANSPNLAVSAFAHNHRDSIFHPKFCWFKKTNGGILIVGSGNLTIRGLRKNWEGFTVMELTNQEIQQVIAVWNNWKHNCAPFFLPITDSSVILRVQRNVFRRRGDSITTEEQVPVEPNAETPSGPIPIAEPEMLENTEEQDDLASWRIDENQPTLIAEIPRASNRWNQGNFSQDVFENFFGGTRWDNSYRILLRKVDVDGELAAIENRQAVSVASHNWRFELGAAAGLNYPDVGRPTGVFIRVGIRMFLYVLVMPGDESFQELNRFLTTQWRGRSDRMRRVISTPAVLRAACPSLPFWRISEGTDN